MSLNAPKQLDPTTTVKFEKLSDEEKIKSRILELSKYKINTESAFKNPGREKFRSANSLIYLDRLRDGGYWWKMPGIRGNTEHQPEPKEHYDDGYEHLPQNIFLKYFTEHDEKELQELAQKWRFIDSLRLSIYNAQTNKYEAWGEGEEIRKILLGDKKTVNDFFALLHNSAIGYEIIQKTAESHYDAIFFSARSGISHAYTLAGYLEQMRRYCKELGIQTKSPNLMAFWHKIRHRPFNPTVLEDTVKKLKRLIAINPGKKQIVVGYYDETVDTRSTTEQMKEYLEKAATEINSNKKPDRKHDFRFVELTQTHYDPKYVTTKTAASWPTWHFKEIDENNYKVVKPSYANERIKHTLHRILTEIFKERGKEIASYQLREYERYPAGMESFMKHYKVSE